MSFWQTSVGGVPVLGSIINGAKAITNFGKAGIDYATGETEDAKDHFSAGCLDTAKAIPYAGTALSVYEAGHDLHAGRPTEEHLWDPSAPVREQSLAEETREWMFGRRPEGGQQKTVPMPPAPTPDPGPGAASDPDGEQRYSQGGG